MKIKYKPWAKGLMYLVEAVVIILSVFPILWVVMSSFKTNGEILSSPLALPAHFSLDTFIEIFQKYSFPTYFFNSLLAAGVSTLVSLLFYACLLYTSLVTQAKRSFVNLLPDLSVTNLCEEKDNYTAHCVFSTYQTMYNVIDSVQDESGKLFTLSLIHI